MKLIEADEAFRILSDYYHHRTETQADALREALERVPEAVVRCKDCEYADHEVYKNQETWLCRCRAYSHVVEAEGYCSHGERRSDGTERDNIR